MKYWYIVWVNKFDGYYGGWKNKGEDHCVKIPIEAKKYMLLKACISRLGILPNDKIYKIEDFWNLNKPTQSYLRDKKLIEIIGGDLDISNIFEKGRIEKIYEDGSIECANKEAIQFVEALIEKNKITFEKNKIIFEEKYKNLFTNNIVQHNPDEDFWSGF
jgi:hypothetical protein